MDPFDKCVFDKWAGLELSVNSPKPGPGKRSKQCGPRFLIAGERGRQIQGERDCRERERYCNEKEERLWGKGEEINFFGEGEGFGGKGLVGGEREEKLQARKTEGELGER